jgi:hypothetical protein
MSMWRRGAPAPGIYDEIVTARVDAQLGSLGDAFDVIRSELSGSESVDTPLAAMLHDAVDLALAEVKAEPEEGVTLAEAVLDVLRRQAPRTFSRSDELRLMRARLRAIVLRPATEPERPRGSLHASSLIVNAEGESLLDHLRSEFDSADRVDLLCAFVKLSGFEKFRAAISISPVAKASSSASTDGCVPCSGTPRGSFEKWSRRTLDACRPAATSILTRSPETTSSPSFGEQFPMT